MGREGPLLAQQGSSFCLIVSNSVENQKPRNTVIAHVEIHSWTCVTFVAMKVTAK